MILVDDGLATGSSMRVAAMALKQKDPAEIIAAVPLGAPEACAQFESEVDKVVCAAAPEPFRAVAEWYRDFSQTSDEEVRDLLRRSCKANGRDAYSDEESKECELRFSLRCKSAGCGFWQQSLELHP